MHAEAIAAAQARLDQAAAERPQPADVHAALARARAQAEALAVAAAELQSTLPQRVGDAVREGLRAEALPVGRQVAEVRGLMNVLLRRLEGLEGDVAAERIARVDDLKLLVDLITAGWESVDARLARIEARLEDRSEGVVVRMDERRVSGADQS